jgi:tRNA(Ile)-lysidine synthase
MAPCLAIPYRGVASPLFCNGFMSIFVKKVKSVIIELIAPGDKVLVAVSGGADSVALLYLLEQFSKELGYELFVAHLNHLTRGMESDKDASFVEKEANKLSLPVFIDKIDVKKSGLKSSFQESARILRYQFLEDVLMSIKGNKIALGHTADDRIETVLMNLLRGTGLRGLAGIPEARGHVIRPLLSFTRSEIEGLLDEKKLIYRTDSSNNEAKYLRNKIRHEVIPFLRTFNPDISGNLLGLAEIARGEEQWLSEKTRELYLQLVIKEKESLSFGIIAFESQPLAMKRRLVRETFYRLNGSLREITALHVQQVLDLFSRARVGNWLKLPGNVRVICGYKTVCFSLSEDFSSTEIDKKAKRLEIQGVTSLPQIGIQFQARLVEPPLPQHVDHKQAYLDYDKTGENIQIRFFQQGDSFMPLGMSGHKKVKSYFSDQKVPLEERSSIPILTNNRDDIIWVYGERISDFFRVSVNTKKVLFIEGKRL